MPYDSQRAMEGIIVNFRQGRHHQNGNQMVIKIDSIVLKEKAKALSGKTVTWSNVQGTTIKGKVSMPHGNKGAVRAIFEKGMPGQAIGTKVKIE